MCARAFQVLLAHFWNHYAMVYALREWTEASAPPGAEPRREILTAKPAQRPSRWIEWGEMRSHLLSWQGYSILRFDATAADRWRPPIVTNGYGDRHAAAG